MKKRVKLNISHNEFSTDKIKSTNINNKNEDNNLNSSHNSRNNGE